MFASFDALASRIQRAETLIQGSVYNEDVAGLSMPALRVMPKFEKQITQRVQAAAAALDSKLPLEAKINFAACDTLIKGPSSMAPADLPSQQAKQAIASCEPDVTALAAKLQTIQDLSNVVLSSKHIEGAACLPYFSFGGRCFF